MMTPLQELERFNEMKEQIKYHQDYQIFLEKYCDKFRYNYLDASSSDFDLKNIIKNVKEIEILDKADKICIFDLDIFDLDIFDLDFENLNKLFVSVGVKYSKNMIYNLLKNINKDNHEDHIYVLDIVGNQNILFYFEINYLHIIDVNYPLLKSNITKWIANFEKNILDEQFPEVSEQTKKIHKI